MLLNRLMPDSYLDLEIETLTENSRLILDHDFEKHSSSISAQTQPGTCSLLSPTQLNHLYNIDQTLGFLSCDADHSCDRLRATTKTNYIFYKFT